MSGSWAAMLSAVVAGVVYYIGAIPAGVALGLSPWVAGVCAWIGYVGIGAAMLGIGAPARVWLQRKLKISAEPDPKKMFWRVWLKAGLPGLALLAPVTIGPYFAVLLALALGEKPGRTIAWIAGGCVPWSIIFAVIAAAGKKAVGG